jgi:hypothetical protein
LLRFDNAERSPVAAVVVDEPGQRPDGEVIANGGRDITTKCSED